MKTRADRKRAEVGQRKAPPPCPLLSEEGETRSVGGGRKGLSPRSRWFVIPSAFVVHPLIVPSFPAPCYPNSMRPRWTPPLSWNPNVAMTARGPTVISGNPHRIARRSNSHSLRPRGWRGDIDSNSDMDLCGSRNGNRYQTDEHCKLQKSFHSCMR